MDLDYLYYMYHDTRETLDELSVFNSEFTLFDEVMYSSYGIEMSLSEMKNQIDIEHMRVTKRNKYTLVDLNDTHPAVKLNDFSLKPKSLTHIGDPIYPIFLLSRDKKYLKWRNIMKL